MSCASNVFGFVFGISKTAVMPPRVNAPVAMIADTTWITSQYDESASVSGATGAYSQITAIISTVSTNATTIGAIHASFSLR